MTQRDIKYESWRLWIWPRQPTPSPEEPTEVLAPFQLLSKSRTKLIFGLSALMLFCFVYGFLFSILVPNFFAFLIAPVGILALLVIWVLPDAQWAPTRLLSRFFFATFIFLIVWPNYLAISLPGLPWITMIRLTSLPMGFLLLVCISMSVEFRAQLTRSLKSVPAIPILLGVFIVIQIYSIALSQEKAESVQKFIVAQTTWTAMFFAGAYVFRRPGRFKLWAMIMWAMAIVVGLMSLWEYHLRHVIWLGHIPSFLKIDDDSVQAILAGDQRAFTNIYRTQATFSTPLGLAEYLALTLPFVMHFATRRFSQRIRIAAIVSIPLILYGCYLTNAKLGMVGSLFGILLYIFGVAFRNWRSSKGSLVAASFLFSYPASLGLVVGAMLASHRFSVLILGNDGSHAASTDTRIEQWTIGLQKFLQWPFGYGIGMGALTINPGAVSDRITIDTYYLSILLEYGIAGFIVYYGMFAIAIYEAGQRSLFTRSENEDRSFLLPIFVSLVVFIVIKSVFSQQDNHPVVFMILGAMMAISASYGKVSVTRRQQRVSSFRRELYASPRALETKSKNV